MSRMSDKQIKRDEEQIRRNQEQTVCRRETEENQSSYAQEQADYRRELQEDSMTAAIWFRSNGPQEYRFLSNFFPVIIRTDNRDWPSAEHLYQAFKTDDFEEQELIRTQPTAVEAMRRGRRNTLQEGWGPTAAMHLVLRLKFANPTMRRRLLDTGDAELIENNRGPWGGKDGGENRLGKLLMGLREDLREEAS